MKKTVCVFVTLCMLLGMMPVLSFAASPDVCFSVEGASGSAGDTVEVKVNLTVNPGIWAARFTVNFDASALTLVDVANGTVFRNGEFIKSKLDFDGYYIYYAQLDSYGENNTNTGTILTLTFRISDTAKNGDYNVYLTFPNHGVGWFFDGKNPTVDYTVPADGEVNADVTVNTVSYLPGDLNSDNKRNAVDCNILKMIYVGTLTPDSVQRLAGDLNGDGKINAVDINMLKWIIIGIED